MLTRDRVRTWLSTLGVIGLFLAVQPYFRYQGGGDFTPATAQHVQENPGDMPFTEDYMFGWYASPLVHYQGARTLTEVGGRVTVSASKRTSVNWLSWSSLTLAVGVGLLWAAKRLRPAPPKPPEPVS